ncbi:hypothetical protein Sden_3548 [Shewanella denitrificans OS217]|jgi:hypothetical protein|uniref:CopL family metal-binding regulatory protein n=1 Tax=Shewanella denitrificans (strain OS217 / ATCC BAA-1090 / DSM 15013) TaxID=318161 RepID=Q12IA3_SHEDO|nr:hypothetical protein Sden_3548 [Shewanella denitrificans OS217]
MLANGEYTLRKTQLIMMFVLMAFVGQAFASVFLPSHMTMPAMSNTKMTMTASCDETSAHHALMLSQMEMENRYSIILSSADNSASSSQNSGDCCENSCRCPVSSCMSVALTMAMPVLKSEIRFIEPFLLPSAELSPQYNVSLYRPPIFA